VKRRRKRPRAPAKRHPPSPSPAPLPERAEGTRAIALFAAVSAALLAVRIVAAWVVGFGDSEALYACYALHPAPAYLDHPGLVGVFARALGSGGAPSPFTAHVATAALATATPWLAAWAARACGATRGAAATAGLVIAVTPEIAIGLFAMTPDALLAPAWLAVIGAAATALAAPPSASRAAAGFVFAGLFAGVAAASKVTGLLLFPALALAYAAPPARRHARSIWPWAGLAAGALVVAPVALFEASHGWPMLAHRLVATQSGAGVSLRNAGALVGGQIAYLSPIVAFLAAAASLDLVRRRRDDAASHLLFAAFALPFAALAALSLWSRVAEPHWLAPALLAPAIHAARRASSPGTRATPRLVAWGAGVAVAIVAAVHAWVLVPPLARLAPKSSDPRYDIANELFGWPAAIAQIRDTMRDESGDLVIVGPHWVVCAQIHAALGPGARVGCATPIRDDFDDWEPRAGWERAEKILFVTDNRFDADPARLFPGRALARTARVDVLRGGRVARAFSISLWERAARADGRLDFGPTGR